MAVAIEPVDARLVSDVCRAIYRAHPEASYVCAYVWNAEKQAFDLSFRSDKNGKDFDVSEIARKFTGGGHRNAAGAQTDSLKKVLD